MTGYTTDELRAYHRALKSPLRRYQRFSLARLFDLLQSALLDLVERSQVEIIPMPSEANEWRWN